MRLFGQFLIEKKIINEETLLSCLVEQAVQVPPPAKLLYDMKALTQTQLLSAFSYQTRFQVDFQAACEALSLWTPQIRESVSQAQKKSRPPLGQMLVKRGDADLQILIQALDEFAAFQSKTDAVVILPTPASTIEPDLLQAFLPMMQDDQRSEMEQQILSWEQNSQILNRGKGLDVSLRTVRFGFNKVKGAARFIGAVLMQSVAHQAEQLMWMVSGTLSGENAEDLEKMTTLSLMAVDLLWELRSCLQKTGAETSFISDSSQKKRVETFFEDAPRFAALLTARKTK